MSDPSRRRVLKIGAALTSVGAVGGLAGCSFLGGGGGSVTYDWMYAPGNVRDVDHYTFRYLEPKSIDENEDEFDERTFANVEAAETRFEFTGIDFDEVTAMLSFGPVTLLSAEFDARDLGEELEDRDFDEEGTERGFTLYESGFGDGLVAHQGNLIVITRSAGNEDAEDVFEAVLEASNTADERYVTDSEDFGALVDALGKGTIVTGGTHEESTGLPGAGGGGAIGYGQTVEGRLTESDQTGFRGNYDAYVFQGEAGDRVTISMESDPGDTYLILLGPRDQEVARDDDGGDRGFNSEMTVELPEDGQYRIIATSFSSGATFPYTLELQGEGGGGGPAPDVLEGIVAEGSRIGVDGDTTERTWALVFDDEDDATAEDVRDRIDEMENAVFEEYDDIAVGKSGRTISITATIDTDELRI